MLLGENFVFTWDIPKEYRLISAKTVIKNYRGTTIFISHGP